LPGPELTSHSHLSFSSSSLQAKKKFGLIVITIPEHTVQFLRYIMYIFLEKSCQTKGPRASLDGGNACKSPVSGNIVISNYIMRFVPRFPLPSPTNQKTKRKRKKNKWKSSDLLATKEDKFLH
jgi:hypothetical protein